MDDLAKLEVMEMLRRAARSLPFIQEDAQVRRGIELALSYLSIQLGERSNLPAEADFISGLPEPNPVLVARAKTILLGREAWFKKYGKALLDLGVDHPDTVVYKQQYRQFEDACVRFFHEHLTEWLHASLLIMDE
jgi:hypothetical protein